MLQILIFVIMGIVLVWFGYSLFIRLFAELLPERKSKPRQAQFVKGTVLSGSGPQVCPICSTRLNTGELVKTHAFPSITGGRDRLMHIRGCVYCINGGKERRCPVCGAVLLEEEILIARMFERLQRRSHIHVIGCSRCRRAGNALPKLYIRREVHE